MRAVAPGDFQLPDASVSVSAQASLMDHVCAPLGPPLEGRYNRGTASSSRRTFHFICCNWNLQLPLDCIRSFFPSRFSAEEASIQLANRSTL